MLELGHHGVDSEAIGHQQGPVAHPRTHLHGRIDILETSHTILDEDRGLVDHRQDEAQGIEGLGGLTMLGDDLGDLPRHGADGLFIVRVEALATLLPPAALGDHPVEQFTGLEAIAEGRIQRVHDLVADLDADHVGQGEGPHREAQRRDAGVHVLGRGRTVLERQDGLVE